MAFVVRGLIHMEVETGTRAMGWDVCFQTGGRFQPVLDVMPWHATALLIEVKSVVANLAFTGLWI